MAEWFHPLLALAVAVFAALSAALGLPPLAAFLAPDKALERYPYFHAARADLLRRKGLYIDAAAAYTRALELTANAAEQRFLRRRLAAVTVPEA